MTENINIVKRDGRVVPFDLARVQMAVFKAAYNGKINGNFISSYHVDPVKANFLANNVAKLVYQDLLKTEKKEVDIEEIQNLVVKHLNVLAKFVGQAYLTYKTQRRIERGLS